MPKQDLLDGQDSGDNVIDLRAHLRDRAGPERSQDQEAEPGQGAKDVYRHAEYGDGRPPNFNRHDLLWLGVIVSIACILWMAIHH